MLKPKHLAILVAAATVAFAVSPALTPGFAGFSADQFPLPQVNPPIQPAGFAFAIWGVIYLWLIIGAGYGVARAPDHPDWQAMRPPLAASLGIGAFWIAVANLQPLAATVMILVMAAFAVLAMARAGTVSPGFQRHPIALYAGWLTAASGVAIGVSLAGYGVISAQVAAVSCLIGVLAVALWVQSLRPAEWAYPVAVAWALFGIIAANWASGNALVIGLGTLGIAVLAARALRFAQKGELK